MELEHLISREVLQSTILFGTAGTDVPSLRAFLRNDSEYDYDNIDYHAPQCMCYHIDSEVLPKEATRLTPPDQSPRNHMSYLQEKVDRLQAR